MAAGKWIIEPLVFVREAEAVCRVLSGGEASNDVADLNPKGLLAALAPVLDKWYDEPEFEELAHPRLYQAITKL